MMETPGVVRMESPEVSAGGDTTSTESKALLESPTLHWLGVRLLGVELHAPADRALAMLAPGR
jgi:hypothetical protein